MSCCCLLWSINNSRRACVKRMRAQPCVMRHLWYITSPLTTTFLSSTLTLIPIRHIVCCTHLFSFHNTANKPRYILSLNSYNTYSLSKQMDTTFADKIGKLCWSYYSKLPSKGKPASHEWTILACFVLHDSITNGIPQTTHIICTHTSHISRTTLVTYKI